MKNNWTAILKLCILSGVISIVCTWGVYQFFPKFLCYVVYDVHESDLQEQWDRIISNEEYIETFTPTNSYIKTIAISITTQKGDEEYEGYVVGRLTDGRGKLIAQDKYLLSAGMSHEYCEFEIEKWVTPGEEYQFCLVFPEEENVSVTFCAADAGPAEHVNLQGKQQSETRNMYLRYIYGTYSKKLLAIWLLVFFIGAYLLTEQLIYKEKTEFIN